MLSPPASQYICELEVKVHSSHHILCEIVFPTPESLLHVSRHTCQHMGAINGTNTVLKKGVSGISALVDTYSELWLNS